MFVHNLYVATNCDSMSQEFDEYPILRQNLIQKGGILPDNLTTGSVSRGVCQGTVCIIG